MDPDADKGLHSSRPSALEEEAPHIMFTPLIRDAMFQEIVGDGTNPLLGEAKRIYEYVTDRVRYSPMRRYTILNIPGILRSARKI